MRIFPSKYLLAYTVSLLLAAALTSSQVFSNPLDKTMISQDVSAQPSITSGSNLITYDNPSHKLKMQYPSDWTVSTNALPTYSGIVAFYSPLQNLQDILPAELSLSITTYLQSVSIDEYTRTTLTALEQQGIQVSEAGAFTLAGKPGHRMLFSPPEPRGQDAPQVSISL